MKQLIITKADGVNHDLTIMFTGKPPSFDSLSEAGRFYEAEANKLAEAMLYTLPGGIVDRLIAALFERRASLFRVPFFDSDE